MAGLAAFWADDWTSETDPDTLAALRAQCSEEAERPDGAETHRWTGGDPLDATDPAYAFDSDDVVTIQRPDRFTLEADGWDNRDIPPPIPLDCADTPVPTATPSFARPAVEQMADKPVPRSRMTEADGPAAVRSEWSDPPALDFDQWCYTEDSASGPMPRPVTLKRWSLRRVLSACVLLAALLGAMSILTLFYSAKASDVTPVPVLPLNAREAKVLPLTTPLDTDEATRPRPDWWDRARDRWRQLLAGRNVQDTRRPRIRK